MPCTRTAAATELLGYIKVLTQAALAPSTQNTYRRAWTTFESFSVEVLGQVSSLPLSVSTISLFVAYLFKKSFSPCTISTYLSALGYVHKMLSLPDNTRSFLVDKLTTGAYRLSQTIDTRLPLTVPILNKMLLALPVILNSCYEQCMFKAMYLFAFSTFARIGELVAVRDVPQENILQLNDVSLTYVQDEAKEVVVSFRKFKHNTKEGAKTIRFTDENSGTSESAIKSLVKFLQLRPKLSGPLFCFTTGQPVSRSYFDRILHKCLDFCQFDSSKYKGHSFRIGAATAAADRGWSDARIRDAGRWKSNAFRKYIRP